MIKKWFDNMTAPENDNVSDKTMSKNIIACVVGVLICVVSLTAATWAWFGDTISSPVNSVETGSYSIDVSVTRVEGDVAITPTEEGGSTYSLTGGQYKIVFAAKGSVSTGYCVVDIKTNGVKKTILSSQISPLDSGKITFLLTVSSDAIVDFAPCWGSHVVEEGVIYFSDGCAYTYDAASSTLTLTSTPDADEG